MTQAEFADRTGLSKKTVNEIINGKAAISPDSARLFQHALGVPSAFWLSRESIYQDHVAKQRENERLASEVSWLDEIPVRQLERLGWIPKLKSPVDRVRACLQFFGVGSSDQWGGIYAEPQAAFRKSTKYEASAGDLAAWMRMGEILGHRVRCGPYDLKGFRAALSEARALTCIPVVEAFERLEAICADNGVAVVLVPQLKKSRASGVTRWLTKEKALIQLSLRYKKDDHLWFSFFHEAAHILLHSKKAVFLEGATKSDSEVEAQADRFARDFLIPPQDFQRLVRMGPPYSRAAVVDFARGVGVAPGIVVGRMQHEKLLSCTHLNGLKVKVVWGS